MTQQINDAKALFYEKKYAQAFKIFKKEEEFYYAGLCLLLLKKEQSAQKFWKKRSYDSHACQWGLCVLDLINLKLPTTKPTFFQTRAQLELYINLFIENNLIEYVQNLISMCDFLYQYNPETYKFIARALYSNGYFDLAITFCKKTLKLFYSDPEAFLILSQCYYLLGNLGEALDCINRVNNIVSDYYPAKLFEHILRQEIEKKYQKKSPLN